MSTNVIYEENRPAASFYSSMKLESILLLARYGNSKEKIFSPSRHDKKFGNQRVQQFVPPTSRKFKRST